MAPEQIQLYVYDLSNGMARQWGRALTGTDVEGIWHTSLVLFGMEVFYGQGISIVQPPGTTHHGTPMKKLSMGATHLDRETFLEYIEGMKEVYAAEKYHLLDFNCNSFTNDVLGFLNGGTIPSDILNLPRTILATPFGQQMRPMIDQMFSGRSGPPASAQTAVNSVLDDVSPSSLTSNLQIVSSASTLSNLIASAPAVAVMFTSTTCGPCVAIKPVFEELARQTPNVSFAIVDINGPGGREVAGDQRGVFGGVVAATPTFRFWEKGGLVGEFKGADRGELETRVKILAMPPKPLTHLALPQLRKLASAKTPLTYTAKPNFAALSTKLAPFLSCASMTSDTPLSPSTSPVLVSQIIPLLSTPSPKLKDTTVKEWETATRNAMDVLPRKEWFPLLDLLRLGITIPSVAPTLLPSLSSLLPPLLAPPRESEEEGKATLLTLLRLVTNSLSHPPLASLLLQTKKEETTALVVRALLDPDAAVRRTAAGLGWSAVIGKRDSDVEWEIEVASAVLEALRNEQDGEVGTSVHRLAATLGVLLLSEANEVKEVLTALGGNEVLGEKVKEGATYKAEVLGLVKEVKAILDE